MLNVAGLVLSIVLAAGLAWACARACRARNGFVRWGGVDPGGHEIGKRMPWRPIGRMDDEELTAVYEYLTHLPEPSGPAAE